MLFRRPARSVCWTSSVLAVLLLLRSLDAHAWDDEGHMIVASIAWRDLAAPQRQRVAELLALNPDFPRWTAHAARGQRDEIAFIRAATWADHIKSDPSFIMDGNRPTDVGAAQNIGYADRRQHRYWHYINVPLSSDGSSGSPPEVPNIETQIRLFRDTLRSEVPDGLKSYDLTWLEHLVGDAHQPLHAASRFSHAAPMGDAGGNRVALCESPCRDELHAFWDNVLGTSESPEDALREAERIPPAPRRRAALRDERAWIQESVDAARDFVYVAPVGPGTGPYRLDDRYRQRALTEARRRVALAGARLARLIKADLR